MPLVVTEQLLLKAFVLISLTSNKAELLQMVDAHQTLSAVQKHWRITFSKMQIVARQLRSERSVRNNLSHSGSRPIKLFEHGRIYGNCHVLSYKKKLTTNWHKFVELEHELTTK